MPDDPKLRAFLETEISRVVEISKTMTDDHALLAGMVVGSLVKSGVKLAKDCGAERSLVELALSRYVEEVYG